MNNKHNFFSLPDIETIKHYMNCSTKEKLNWLEETARFIWKATDNDTKKIMEYFNNLKI